MSICSHLHFNVRSTFFGAGCGLVVFASLAAAVHSVHCADDQEALKRLALPNVSKGEAIRKLKIVLFGRLGFLAAW